MLGSHMLIIVSISSQKLTDDNFVLVKTQPKACEIICTKTRDITESNKVFQVKLCMFIAQRTSPFWPRKFEFTVSMCSQILINTRKKIIKLSTLYTKEDMPHDIFQIFAHYVIWKVPPFTHNVHSKYMAGVQGSHHLSDIEYGVYSTSVATLLLAYYVTIP